MKAALVTEFTDPLTIIEHAHQIHGADMQTPSVVAATMQDAAR